MKNCCRFALLILFQFAFLGKTGNKSCDIMWYPNFMPKCFWVIPGKFGGRKRWLSQKINGFGSKVLVVLYYSMFSSLFVYFDEFIYSFAKTALSIVLPWYQIISQEQKGLFSSCLHQSLFQWLVSRIVLAISLISGLHPIEVNFKLCEVL